MKMVSNNKYFSMQFVTIYGRFTPGRRPSLSTSALTVVAPKANSYCLGLSAAAVVLGPFDSAGSSIVKC